MGITENFRICALFLAMVVMPATSIRNQVIRTSIRIVSRWLKKGTTRKLLIQSNINMLVRPLVLIPEVSGQLF